MNGRTQTKRQVENLAVEKTIPDNGTPDAKQESLEEILQTMLEAHRDLTVARELLDSLEERLYFHGELKWRTVAGELAGLIEAHTERRLSAINLLLLLQKA